jgi:hypothetical protein
MVTADRRNAADLEAIIGQRTDGPRHLVASPVPLPTATTSTRVWCIVWQSSSGEIGA